MKPKRGGWKATKFKGWWLESHKIQRVVAGKPQNSKGGRWTAKNTPKNTCYHMITCESHDKT